MAAELGAGLVAPALFAAAGAGLQALAPRPLERGVAARLGLALLFGLAWCTLGVWLASFTGAAPVAAPSFVVAAGVAIAAGALAVAVRRGDLGGLRLGDRSAGRRGRWARWVVVVVLGVVSSALLADASVHPVVDFDGRMVWGTLARYVQADESVLPEALVDPQAYVIHPRYPLVMPLAQVAAAELTGQGIESRAVRPLYALLLPALVAALWPSLVRVGGRRGAALATLVLFTAPMPLWSPEVGPSGTYSDFPLAAMLGAAASLLLHPLAGRESWRGWFAGLPLAAAAGVKNEGLVLAPLLFASFLLLARRRGGVRTSLRAAAVLALGLTLVVGWRSQVPNRNDEAYFEELSPSAIAAGLVDRFGFVAESALRQSFDPSTWGGAFWVLPPLLLIAGRRGLRARAVRLSGLWIGGQMAMVLAAYSVTPSLAVVHVTWNRFLVQILGPLAFLAAAAAGAALRAARRRAARRGQSR